MSIKMSVESVGLRIQPVDMATGIPLGEGTIVDINNMLVNLLRMALSGLEPEAVTPLAAKKEGKVVLNNQQAVLASVEQLHKEGLRCKEIAKRVGVSCWKVYNSIALLKRAKRIDRPPLPVYRSPYKLSYLEKVALKLRNRKMSYEDIKKKMNVASICTVKDYIRRSRRHKAADLETMWRKGYSSSEIAKVLGYHLSTVCHSVSRLNKTCKPLALPVLQAGAKLALAKAAAG